MWFRLIPGLKMERYRKWVGIIWILWIHWFTCLGHFFLCHNFFPRIFTQLVDFRTNDWYQRKNCWRVMSHLDIQRDYISTTKKSGWWKRYTSGKWYKWILLEIGYILLLHFQLHVANVFIHINRIPNVGLFICEQKHDGSWVISDWQILWSFSINNPTSDQIPTMVKVDKTMTIKWSQNDLFKGTCSWYIP